MDKKMDTEGGRTRFAFRSAKVAMGTQVDGL